MASPIHSNAEHNRFRRRSIVCATGVFILFLILILRLVYLQVLEHRFYATLSQRNVISVVPVKPERGIIYDRNGVVLAKNIPVYSLMVTPGRVPNLDDTLDALKKTIGLTSDDIDTFKRIARQYYPYQAVPLKQQLTEAQVDAFYVDQYRFPGVTVQTNMIRNYPLANTLSNVVGYVGRITAKELAEVDPADYTASDDIGKAGVEAEDEELLHGTMGSEQAEIDANGKVVRILKISPAVPGDNIYLTIDSKLQVAAEKAMGDDVGAVVAIQPSTGQVLALVTKPNYDPNEFSGHMTSAQYHAIIDAPDHPLFNRAIRATYAPGSTVKPFIAFSAMNDGIIDTKDYILDPGYFRLPNTKHVFHNWVHTGFGWVNVTKAIMVSCDTFFYQLATVLGIDRLDQAYNQFGFGQLTGINLPGERAGVVPSPAWKEKHIGQPWYEGDTVVAGIGQGYVAATPLQLAAATAIMANRGLKYQPTVLLKLQQPNGDITEMQPIIEQPIVAKDPKTWETIIGAMQQVTSAKGGTAYNTFLGSTYTSAGKTGTAQVYASNKDDMPDDNTAQKNVPKRLQNNHLFICFAPVDNPQIVVAVTVEHIAGMSQRAVQIARQVIDFYMQEQKEEAKAEAAQPALPAPQGDSQSNATAVQLPQPAGAKTIQKELQDDLKQEMRLQKVNQSDAAATPDTNTPPADSAQLQQQMDANIDMQMDMGPQTSPSTPPNNAPSPSSNDATLPPTTGFQKRPDETSSTPTPAPASTTTTPQ